MKDGDIIVIANVEVADQDGKEYRLVTDKAGNQYKFKSGRGGSLEKKWPLLESSIDKAIKLKVEQFKGFDFVADFTVVADEFIAQATQKAQTQQGDAREKSVAISYAKDMVVAKIIQPYEIAEWAELFYRYITGKLQVEETRLIALIEEGKYETTKAQTTQATIPVKQPEADTEVGTDEAKPKTIGEFLAWIVSNGVKAPRPWLEEKFGVKRTEILTLKKCQELYKTIQEKEGW